MNKKALIPIGLILAAGAAYYFLRIRAGDDGSTLTLQGNVDIRDAGLGFRVGGRVTALLLDEGDRVSAGQVMARLDAEPYTRVLEDAVAQVGALRARMDLVEAGFRPEEIAQARALVDARRVALRNAERQLARETELSTTGASPEKRLDDALAVRDDAVAQLKLAEASLALVESGSRPEEIAQARANLAAGEAALAGARLQLKDTVLEAPADGVILTRAVEPGMIVSPGAPIYVLSLPRPVWVRAFVSGPDLGRIRPGMPVTVHSDSAPGRPYEGQVGFISPTAEFTPKTVETRDLRTGLVYRIRVIVDEPDEGLRQGMPVTVTIDATALNRRE